VKLRGAPDQTLIWRVWAGMARSDPLCDGSQAVMLFVQQVKIDAKSQRVTSALSSSDPKAMVLERGCRTGAAPLSSRRLDDEPHAS